MPAIMSHLIGTAALVVILLGMSAYLMLVVNNQTLTIAQSKLQSVSDNVAVYASKLIAMANMSNTDSCIQIQLDIPLTVSTTSGYSIALANDNGTYQVKAATLVQPYANVSSIITVNSRTANVQVELTDGLQINNVVVKSRLYGGVPNTIIWARRLGNTIQIGLGTRLSTYTPKYQLTVKSIYDSPSGSGSYDSGSIVYASIATNSNISLTNSSIATNIDCGNGTKRVFVGWSGDATGFGFTSGPIVMDRAKTAIANWATWYYFGGGGYYTIDTPSGYGWYDSGSTAQASLSTGTISGGTGIQYLFTGWSGDASGTGLTSSSIIMNGPKNAVANWKTQYYLTVNNGGHGTANGQGWYNAGSSASFSIGSASGWTFTGWTGLGAGSYTGSSSSSQVTMNNAINETANWKRNQYYIKVTSDHDNPNPMSGLNPVNPGNSFTASVTNPSDNGTGIKYVCTGYSIDGGGSQSGTSYTFSNVQANHTITFLWKKQCYLTVNSAYDSPSGKGWYDANSVASFSVTSPASGPTGTQYLCTGYSGDASGSGSSGSITMSAPKSITFNWMTQYYLTVNNGGHGTANGQGWYNAGSSASFSIGSASGWTFTGWTGLGAGSYTGPSSSHQVTMNNAINEMANWKRNQYYITVTSSHDSPTASAWVDPGSSFTASVTSPTEVTSTQQWVCTGYSVDEGSSQSGTSYTFSNIQANHTLTFTWKLQYYLTMATNFGTISPTSGWYDVGSVVRISSSPPSAGSGERYTWNGWTGMGSGSFSGMTQSSSVTMNGAITETASWKHQFQITFDQSGLSYFYSGTVVTIDSTAYSRSNLPASFWWDEGSSHSFSFQSSCGSRNWYQTTGLSSSRSGTIRVSASGSVTGYYR